MVTLELAKQHLNLEADYVDDDTYIQALIEVAEQAVEVHVNEKLEDIADEEGNIPKPLLQAMLLMIGNLYQNREMVAPMKVTALPYNYEYLINLYKNYNR
jgi:uncharacterized phage protein (predicted DNA packaging)